MKNISSKLITLFKSGYCTPQIARVAKKLKEPSTTIHYNIKKLEKNETIRAYKAVFDYKKIDQGFCNYALVNLSPDEYGDPEKIGEALAKDPHVESIDICTGDWELVVKIRVKDQDEYYNFIKHLISKRGIIKIKSLTAFKQIKTEFITL
jgi:Lrp/AsnC family transcriptional regulator, leucine-responsive regulatory protein